MHKQAGYKQLGTNAYLYNTKVAELHGDLLELRTGGWVTQSTAKAINATLKDWGIDHIWVNRVKGTMVATLKDSERVPFVDDRILIRWSK